MSKFRAKASALFFIFFITFVLSSAPAFCEVRADDYFKSLQKASQKENPSSALVKRQSKLELPDNYPIRAGDKLNIQVYREKDLTGIFTVDLSGNISYPLLGEVHVQGLSLEDLRKYLINRLGKDYLVNPQLQVDLDKSLNKSVSILGQVQKPGNYDFAPDMTLVRLISEAGGFTPIAAPKHVKITRLMKDGKKKTVIVDVDSIMNGKSEDISLQSSDLVMVPESYF